MINLWYVTNIAIGIAPNTTATTITVWLLIAYFVKKVTLPVMNHGASEVNGDR